MTRYRLTRAERRQRRERKVERRRNEAPLLRRRTSEWEAWARRVRRQIAESNARLDDRLDALAYALMSLPPSQIQRADDPPAPLRQ